MGKLFWIIDEEWSDYDYETETLKKNYPDCEIHYSGYGYQDDLEKFGYKADAVITQIYTDLPESTIDRLEKCKGIAVYGGGFDRVDIAAAGKKGIPVTNVQGYCAEDLADYVMAAVYHFKKKLTGFTAQIRQGLWGAQAVPVPASRVAGSVLMLVGFGRIGSTVAEKAIKLGMAVIAFDPHVDGETMAKSGVRKVSREEGFALADFVSVHAKLYEETRGLISAKDFALMKPTACLINTARGAVIVEDDLIDAVESGKIAGAVVDVITTEPPMGNERIFSCKNILVTPHISYISRESYHELKSRAVANAMAMLSGERPADVVNLDYLV